MDRKEDGRIPYSVWDPTGNITALVESEVETKDQPGVAARIMKRHPEVEQVGFFRMEDEQEQGISAALRMAGGEFCGNATMCAAALLLSRRGKYPDWDTPRRSLDAGDGTEGAELLLRVSGAVEPVRVRLRREAESRFSAGVRMPPAAGMEEVTLEVGTDDLNGIRATPISVMLPLVRMEGISHLIVEEGSPFFFLRDTREAAARCIRKWCCALGADGLGLMFVSSCGETEQCLTPLVYVPGSDTLFWENSCASGTSALGMLLAARKEGRIGLALKEPGGTLRVESDPETGETWLFGTTSLMFRSLLEA